jgi:ribosomal protein S18 acetylase RimI-like enzyme
VNTEFRQAVLPQELRSLCAFDRKVFPSDYFPPSEWKSYESYWLILNGKKKIGCCAFEVQGDTLYIATTGILPAFQGMGFGKLMKLWQIAYARRRGFKRITTNSRQSNKAMIALNRQFGFRRVRTLRGYYEDPKESAILMALDLSESPG